jgi:hypothetical protein
LLHGKSGPRTGGAKKESAAPLAAVVEKRIQPEKKSFGIALAMFKIPSFCKQLQGRGSGGPVPARLLFSSALFPLSAAGLNIPESAFFLRSPESPDTRRAVACGAFAAVRIHPKTAVWQTGQGGV